jgi:hypothetical protein
MLKDHLASVSFLYMLALTTNIVENLTVIKILNVYSMIHLCSQVDHRLCYHVRWWKIRMYLGGPTVQVRACVQTCKILSVLSV